MCVHTQGHKAHIGGRTALATWRYAEYNATRPSPVAAIAQNLSVVKIWGPDICWIILDFEPQVAIKADWSVHNLP
jgi:hypothetical protein